MIGNAPVVDQAISGNVGCCSYPGADEYAVAGLWLIYSIVVAHKMQASGLDPFEGPDETDEP